MSTQKRPRTEKQLANDQRLKDEAAQRRAAQEQPTEPIAATAPVAQPEITGELDIQPTRLDDLQRQLNEVMETNALLKAAILNSSNNQQSSADSVSVGRGNKLVGEVDKYLVDPAAYPDPTTRLASEPRLETIAFKHNYDLEYEFRVSSYETKTGINMREPDFLVTLHRVVYDSQGAPVIISDPKTGKPAVKRYIARRLSFKEDPQAALVIARENSLLIDKTDEKAFLDEMRYLRVRDWLFDVFWPKPASSLVQISTRSSVDASSPDFDALGDSKLTV